MTKKKFTWKWLEALFVAGGLPLTVVAAGGGNQLVGVITISIGQNMLYLLDGETMIEEFQNLSSDEERLFLESVEAIQYASQNVDSDISRNQLKLSENKLLELIRNGRKGVCVKNNLAVLYILQSRCRKARKLLRSLVSTRYENIVRHNQRIAEIRSLQNPTC